MRFLSILLLCATTAGAVEPDEILSDPVLETRARDISANLRCVVCQNEPIDSSNAAVAKDLRLLVRERLVAGDTDRQVFDFVVARYGDYVLFKPRWQTNTYALWLAPVFLAIIGVFLLLATFRRCARKQDLNDTLTQIEQAEFLEASERYAKREDL